LREVTAISSDLKEALSEVKSFSLSLSHRLIERSYSRVEDQYGQEVVPPLSGSELQSLLSVMEEDSRLLAVVIKLMPQLETLELHWYRI
jgi:hypothetical protein